MIVKLFEPIIDQTYLWNLVISMIASCLNHSSTGNGLIYICSTYFRHQVDRKPSITGAIQLNRG